MASVQFQCVHDKRLFPPFHPTRAPALESLNSSKPILILDHDYDHPPTMPNIRVLRDMKARHGVNANEIVRRAYLYVARNQTLPPQVRYQAQLQLNTFSKYTRPTTVKNRCSESGKGRGVIGEFALCRVSPVLVFVMSCVE